MTEDENTELAPMIDRAKAYDQLKKRVDEMGFATVNDALDELKAKLEER